MSELQSPVTYEGLLEMFKETRLMIQATTEQMKETDRKMEETDRRMKETDRKMKETDRKISALGSRIGEIIENMVAGNIVEKFQAFGYEITESCPRKRFENKTLAIRGEVDLFLENGDVAILVEVKTTLESADVRKHVERLEKFRSYTDAKGNGDKRHFIGAVAGAVVLDDAADVAHENGMYVIVQSGEAVEIVTPPEGFVAKEW